MRRSRIFNGHAILSIRSININTGKSKYFNVYETWEENDNNKTTCELWQIEDCASYNDDKTKPKYRIHVTSGSKALFEIGSIQMFSNDQTGSYKYHATLIDSSSLTNLKKNFAKYGTSFTSAVYK